MTRCTRLLHNMSHLTGTLLTLLADVIHFLRLCLCPSAVLAAENLFLRKQLALYQGGGVGRTGVIIGCWLARHGLGGAAALTRLRELWRHCPKPVSRASPETQEQAHYIMRWEAGR